MLHAGHGAAVDTQRLQGTGALVGGHQQVGPVVAGLHDLVDRTGLGYRPESMPSRSSSWPSSRSGRAGGAGVDDASPLPLFGTLGQHRSGLPIDQDQVSRGSIV